MAIHHKRQRHPFSFFPRLDTVLTHDTITSLAIVSKRSYRNWRRCDGHTSSSSDRVNPAAHCHIGLDGFLPDLVKRKYHSGWFSTTYLLSILLLFSLIYPVSVFLSPYKSSYELSQVIKSKLPAGETVYQINLFLYGIESYTDIRTAAVIDFGEMEFGMQKLPPAEKSRYFLSYEDFRHLISQKKGDVYCVTANQDNLNYLRKQFPHLQIIWTNHFYYFFRLPH